MTSRTRRRAGRTWIATLAVACIGGMAGPAVAKEKAEAKPQPKAEPNFEMPGWLANLGATGKYVDRNGSKGKFLEDYNKQSGLDGALDWRQVWKDGSYFRLQGLGQSGEKQGYAIGEYGDLSTFDLVLDLEAWTEYYNNRTGDPSPTGFPGTNDGRLFYGNGIPSTDWLTVGGTVDVDGNAIGVDALRDLYLDFHYRNVDGNQTLLKAGTVDGTQVPGSGPGTIDFDFPGRKHVDYDEYMSFGGGRSEVGGINWQTDVVYQYYDIQSTTSEPNYTNGSIDEVGRFTQDSKIHVVKYDLAGSRNLSPDFFVFGSGFFSFERNDPEPDQFISSGGNVFQTRTTTGSKVTRFTPSLSFGTVYHPDSRVVVTTDTHLRGHVQKGDLDESRDESNFLTGDFGTVHNSVDRNSIVSTTRIHVDWRATSDLSVEGEARYRFLYQDIDSRQDTAFVQLEPAEVEKWSSKDHRLLVGPSVRYRMRHGRSIEGGYRFSYSDLSQDIDKLQNQFILGDYDARRHRVYLKGSGRILKNLRGELRGQYVYEDRNNDAPSVRPVIVGSASEGKVKTQFWNVTPMLYYLPHRDWSLYGTYSIGQVRVESKNGNAFEYKTLTQSVSSGITYRATERWSATGSYTLYVNDDSVENVGHNAALTGDFRINDNWKINGGYRYIKYNLSGSGLDDYDANIVSLGVTGTF